MMENYSFSLKVLFLSSLFLTLSNSVILSQSLADQASIDLNKLSSLRFELPENPLSNSYPVRKLTAQNDHFSSDSDLHPSETPLKSGSNPQIPSTEKNAKHYLSEMMQEKMKNNKKNEGSTSFTRNSSFMNALNLHEDDKVQEYVKTVVQSNRKMISMHNSNSRKRYRLAQNRFIIYTTEEFKERFLNLKTPNQSYVKYQPLNIEVVVPSGKRLLQSVTIDWKTANRMTSVKFQKQCGACYAFTAVSAIESAYILKGKYLNLAEQELIDCSAPYQNYGCTGGWTTNAYKYIKDFGVVYEADYPFSGDMGKCSVDQKKQKYKIKNFVELKNDCNLVIEALKVQPLSIAINADGWQYYAGGVYTDCRTGHANHGVVLAGVNAQSWLIKNSWGYSWGESGYIRVSRTAPNKACSVCEWASYPII